jgi:threonine aldolase
VTEERDPSAVWAACERVLAGEHPRARDPRTALAELAERAPSLEESDRYGGGAIAERLESRVAELLGKETALWLPSGTMAQQIALRIHADRAGVRTVAFHPHCHLDVHEERGYERLHGLHAVLLGDRDRPIVPGDLEEVQEPLAAVLLELPQRDLGGTLPPWDELVELCDAVRERGGALHLDGARLWQCGPYYGRPLAEIAGLFDTVYVSFYKDLSAPAGCALAGPRDVIDEARVWQVRHGGRLFSVYPLLLAAERGLDEVLPRMPEVVAYAREVGCALAELDGIDVVPDPPVAAMFHLHVRRDAERVRTAALDVAERTRVWPGGAGARSVSGGHLAATELSLGVAAFEVPVAEARELWVELLSRSA